MLLRQVRTPVFWYRVARRLALLHVPLLPGFIDYAIRFTFSCWLPHQATLGSGVVLGYGGLGCVIHAGSVIGNRVHIDQNVTLGGNGRERGVPVIEDDVYIGASALILGPVRVGSGSVVGAGSVVIRDIPKNCVVAGNPARVVREGIVLSEFLYHLKASRSTR